MVVISLRIILQQGWNLFCIIQLKKTSDVFHKILQPWAAFRECKQKYQILFSWTHCIFIWVLKSSWWEHQFCGVAGARWSRERKALGGECWCPCDRGLSRLVPSPAASSDMCSDAHCVTPVLLIALHSSWLLPVSAQIVSGTNGITLMISGAKSTVRLSESENQSSATYLLHPQCLQILTLNFHNWQMMLQTFQQIQCVLLRRAFIILKLWCFSRFFSSFLSQSRCFMFIGSLSVFQLMKMYFVSLCLSARVAWLCASATNHLTNGTAEHFQCFCVCRYIFHTNRWARLIQPGANCECSNLPQVLRLPMGPPGSWGVNALALFRVAKRQGELEIRSFLLQASLNFLFWTYLRARFCSPSTWFHF